jgi:phage-related protein
MPKSVIKPSTRAQAKPVTFIGSSLDDLRDFPKSARRNAGFQLDKVQSGKDPDDWKPMPNLGAGTCEIRVRDEAGAFRVMYVAKFKEAIFVLHAFQKKTQKTSKKDVQLAKDRYAEMIELRKQQP